MLDWTSLQAIRSWRFWLNTAAAVLAVLTAILTLVSIARGNSRLRKKLAWGAATFAASAALLGLLVVLVIAPNEEALEQEETQRLRGEITAAREESKQAVEKADEKVEELDTATTNLVRAEAELAKTRERLHETEAEIGKLKPRRLTEREQHTLLKLLSRYRGSRVRVLPICSDPESNGYAKDFAKLLKNAGWQLPDSGGYTCLPVPFAGIKVTIKVPKNVPEAATALAYALTQIGIKPKTTAEPDKNPDSIDLKIGHK